MATIQSKHRVAVLTRVDPQEFLQNLLGASGTDWDWWMTVEFDEGYDWDTHPTDPDHAFLTLGIEHPSEEGLEFTRKVSASDLRQAHDACIEEGYAFAWDNHDASSADSVLQMAVLGEVVYG
jgi:hypothetical protein